MSHYFFRKRLWVVLIGIVLLMGIFFSSVFMWLERAEQYVLEMKLPMEEVETEERGDTAMGSGQTQHEVQMAALQSETPVVKHERKMEFPCMIQIVDGEIGVYQEQGGCLKTLKQVGERLTEEDEQRLLEGIYIVDEKELIMVLESYHLQ